MKSLADIRAVLKDVDYRGWMFVVEEEMGAAYLQIKWWGLDAETDQPGQLSSRKWRLSWHMTRSELVQTALKAVLAAEEHETRERFKYRGKPIFGPHLNVDVLWEMAGTRDVRD